MTLRITFLVLSVAASASARPPVEFSREVLPILSQKCFPCHGPDEASRQADLRLDRRDAAMAANVLSPADSEQSELLRRIRSTDVDEVMPPANAKSSLDSAEKETLARWIAEGAKYEPHWAFRSPRKPKVPVAPPGWANNEIDAFLLDAMRKVALKPSRPADRFTLVRRLYLDLVGLPPTPQQADDFVHSGAPDAYGRLVTKLLQSHHYGEHAARTWLDLARYADSNGYEKDRPRSIWPYRDWVIRAFNDDMPFDQFTIEQLAGDLLPHPTTAQRVATGFHRNTMLNEEGGIDPLEYRFYAMVDRVSTTGTVWLGLTLGCAQCHHHKYDPISQIDYYRFMALLNNADEPDLRLPRSHTREAKAQQKQLDVLESHLAEQFPPDDGVGDEAARRARHLESSLTRWIADQQEHVAPWEIAVPTTMTSNLPKLKQLEDHSIFASGDFTKRDEYTIQVRLNGDQPYTALRLEALPDDRLPAGGPGRAYYEGRKGDFFLSEISLTANDTPIRIKSASRSYGRIAIGSGNAEATNVYDNEGSTGWSTAGREGERHVLVLTFLEPVRTKTLHIQMLFERHFVAGLGRFRFALTTRKGMTKALDLPEAVEQVLLQDRDAWSKEASQLVRHAFLNGTPRLAEVRKPIERLREQLARTATTMVLQERPPDNPRPTLLHHRGEWLSPKERVAPGLPQLFTRGKASQVSDRLSLARWLASRDNPLVARVVVNRVWRQLMGHGLVRTDGDFGTQVTPPNHPQLLDWLACEFMERGWSLKHLKRLIVSSAAYRQQSIVRPEFETQDRINLWFARAPRHRVDGETVRDIMLMASGLLSSKVGGPSVFPPQPAAVTALAYGGSNWKPSSGADRYRRSLYTFSKRTAPFAAYTTFDGPSHELCTARRSRSNTPLQALTLLNDSMYLEMARHLAALVRAQSNDQRQQIASMFRRLLTRPPQAVELDVLEAYHDRQQERLQNGELNVKELLGEPDASVAWASLTLVARVLMNLDETISKQ